MVEALGISLKEFIFYLLNFAVLAGGLWFFLYHPFIGVLEARKQRIQDALDTADATNRRADEKMNNYQRQIANYKEEGREIIRVAKRDANDEAKAIIDEANQKAAEMILQAEKEIERQKLQAMRDMREEISQLALLAASKIVEEEIEPTEKQYAIVDQIIEEAGSSTWQS